MALNISLPQDAGLKTKALADRLQTMANDIQYSDQDRRDTAISALISIVAELERDISAITAADAAREQKAAFDDLQFRSYGGGR
jgi:hypothetical protein